MKAIRVKEFGGPEVLKYIEMEEPIPNENEVRIKLFAAGVNPSDAYTRTGTYSRVPKLPYTPGADGAGVIDAVGSGVKNLKVGDRVFIATSFAKRNTGTYAEKVVCDEECAHILPDFISYEEGASLGVPALTAYRALFQRGKIKPGETVLIHGASGGVGTLAVQMAKAIGATVIGTASTEAGRDLVKASGANYVLDHIKEDSIKNVLDITDGKGPDVIIEFLANVNLETDLKMIAKYGRVVVVGNRGSLEFNPRLTMAKEADVLGLSLVNSKPDEYKEGLKAVAAFLQSGILKPEVGDRLPLENAKESHEEIINKKARGKMVLVIE